MQFIRLRDYDLKNHINERIPVIFMVKQFEIKQYQKGNGEFMSLIIKDRDVETDAKIWTVTQELVGKVKAGLVYEGLIDIKPYDKGKDGISCIIYNLEISSLTAEDFVEWDEHSKQSIEIIKNAISVISGSVYGEITKLILKKEWERFVVWAAGKNAHHVQLGALVTHTANVTKVALKVAQYYNEIYKNIINIQLLLACCIVHDIGKLHELDVNIASGAVEYSKESTLQNHLISGLLEIERAANELGIKSEQSEEVKLMQHMIAAHHGLIEWGSLMTPNIPEAVILHNCDAMDAELWRFDKSFKKISGGEFETVWIGGKAKVIYKETTKNIIQN